MALRLTDLHLWALVGVLFLLVFMSVHGAFASHYHVKVPTGAFAQMRVAETLPRGSVVRTFRHIPWMVVEANEVRLQGLQMQGVIDGYYPEMEATTMLSTTRIRIGSWRAIQEGFDGAGAVVAILDTGFDISHPELGATAFEACFSNASCPDGTNRQIGPGSAAPLDGHVHGTHVAGIAVGTRGMAPAAELGAVMVFSRAGGGVSASFGDIIAGAEHVLDMKAAGHNIVALNMSLGTGPRTGENCDNAIPSVTAIMNLLAASGIVPVAASGNSGSPSGAGIPACISSVVSVGAVNNSDAVAGFSNGKVDVWAQGQSVSSAVPGGGRASLSGTSMSTPHVAGAIAQGVTEPWIGWRILDPRSGGVIRPRLQVDDALGILPPAPVPVPCIDCTNTEIPPECPVCPPPSQPETIEEFCAQFPTRSRREVHRCRAADWQFDEPSRFPRDCWARHSEACIPRVDR